MEQKTGLRKLWAKFKASIRSQTSSRRSTMAVTSPASKTIPSQAASGDAPVASARQDAPSSGQQSKTLSIEGNVHKTESSTSMERVITPHAALSAPSAIEVDEDEEPSELYMPLAYQSFPSTRDELANKERFERAQAVYIEYGKTFEIADWRRPSNATVDRVEKKPRMRVKYTCHECKNVYGREKVCTKCGHNRCNSCTRYPAKKSPEQLQAKKGKRVEAAPRSHTQITEGACHECKTGFKIGAPACTNCEHEICERCLKETVLESPLTAPPLRPPHSTVLIGS